MGEDRAPAAFTYAIVRFVPSLPRAEFVNAGVILFCDALDFLGARVVLDEARVRALSPDVEPALLDLVREHLAAIPQVCAGREGAGPIGALPVRERWHWLVSPRSTLIQTAPPHVGLCVDPQRALEDLFARLVCVSAGARAR